MQPLGSPTAGSEPPLHKMLREYVKGDPKISINDARRYRFLAVDFIGLDEREAGNDTGGAFSDIEAGDINQIKDLTSEEIRQQVEHHACLVKECPKSVSIFEDAPSTFTTHYLTEHTALDNFTLCEVVTCPETPHHLPSLKAFRKHLKELVKGGVTCEVKQCKDFGARFSGVKQYTVHAAATHPELGCDTFKQRFVATTAAEDDEIPLLELSEEKRERVSS